MSKIENININPNNVNTFNYAQKVDYLEENLLILAQSLFPLTKSQGLKKQLYSEIEKKFDGDYNVLFKSLTNLITFQSSSLKNKHLKSVEAFKQLEGRDYFPQLAIPLHKSYLENGIYKKNQDIIIALLTVDGNLLDGYKFNNKGALVKLSHKIDKTFAENNEVWVISLNERYFGENNSNNFKGARNGKVSAGLITKWQISTLNIKKAFEGWGKGASDIYIIGSYGRNDDLAYMCDPNGSNCGSKFDINPFVPNCYIRDVAESDLNKDLTINWRVDNPNSNAPNRVWDDLNVGNAAYFSIYEDDSWPTGWREVKIYAANNTDFLYQSFRSSDHAYCSVRITNTVVNNKVIENDNIKLILNTL